MKKILFIGDLRYVNNYGAYATTQALLDLIEERLKNASIRMIDYRSFSGHTPIVGWEDKCNEKPKFWKLIVNITKKIRIYYLLLNIKKTLFNKKQLKDVVPRLLEEYFEIGECVKEGKVFQFEKGLLEWADIVIINSEGNIVHGTDKNGVYRSGGRYILFMEYLTKCIFDKPCYVINHVVDPQNRNIRQIIKYIYPKMDGVYVRDQLSLELLKKWDINNAKYVPDALWSHNFLDDSNVKKPDILKNFNFDKPYICLGDSSGLINKFVPLQWDIYDVYTKLILELKKICPQIVIVDGYNGDPIMEKIARKNKIPIVMYDTCNYQELYYVLEKASIFISGRWHASIISLMAHTPILLWGSDSHKTESLYREIDYPYEFFDVETIPLNIKRIANEAKKIMGDNHEKQWEIVEELKRKSKLNVDML